MCIRDRDTTKTYLSAEWCEETFESYVILDTTKTMISIYLVPLLFESYVILDTTKTG